jgi:hypothetical protein
MLPHTFSMVLAEHGINKITVLGYLKVVGNEKVVGSRKWHMIDIGLGPW